ncbi:unnamed protein product [Lepeophtheirus salmonis]|uniref:(salmon louse) hypothetical protein n=1 Tax=Lepeophtheirus salmonis TaxID=72036 RepID=A0A7R8H3J4_LEPSM|nr:unnamed protein product [Lepeophtheirus salmonis]CAF2830977.1 unnamed protein product [Lepeophtheirus salmonis]
MCKFSKRSRKDSRRSMVSLYFDIKHILLEVGMYLSPERDCLTISEHSLPASEAHTVLCSDVQLQRLDKDLGNWFLNPEFIFKSHKISSYENLSKLKVLKQLGISPQKRVRRDIALLMVESMSSKKVLATFNRLLDPSFVPNLFVTLVKEIVVRSVPTSHRLWLVRWSSWI